MHNLLSWCRKYAEHFVSPSSLILDESEGLEYFVTASLTIKSNDFRLTKEFHALKLVKSLKMVRVYLLHLVTVCLPGRPPCSGGRRWWPRLPLHSSRPPSQPYSLHQVLLIAVSPNVFIKDLVWFFFQH